MASTHVYESIIIPAPINDVWKAISSLNFDWWSIVKSVKASGTDIDTGKSYEITFKDGTVQTFELAEYSSVKHLITLIASASSPAVQYSSVYHTIQATEITIPAEGHTHATLVQWKEDLSSDANQTVIQDQKYKRKDALLDLLNRFVKK